MHNLIISTKPNIYKRIFAVIIDYSFIIGVTILISILYGEPNEKGGYVLHGFPALGPVLFWFIWTVVAEQYFGTTLGNYIFGLKVLSIKDNQKELTFGQSLKRHLFDMLDFWPPFGLMGYLLIKHTKYNQRLGDLWAKTIVIDTYESEQGIKWSMTKEVTME